MRGRRRWAVVTVAMVLLLSWFGGCTNPEGVHSIPAVVKISPDTLTILTGQTSQLTATAWDANGKELRVGAVTWSSKTPAVATVSSAGLVTGLVLGRDAITAIVNGISGTALVTVLTPTLAKVTVSPDSTGIPSNGTLQLSATLDDGNGHTLIDGPVTWVTRDPSVATVSRAGLVTAVDSGRDTITAFSGATTGVAILDVRGPEQPGSNGILVSDLAPKPTPEAALGSLPPRAPGVAQSSSAAEDSVTYVAIPPGTVPDGLTAKAFNPATGSLVTAAMNAGGLDPVPVGAKAGDTVTVSTTTSGGVTRTIRVPVSSATAPIVIRGQPPKKRTDVPLNSVMAFVFSEPVDPHTISTQTVQLVKAGQLVPGQPVVQQGGLRVDFIPDAPLDPQSTYTLLVTTAVKSLKGRPLGKAEVSTFSTGTFIGGLSFVFVTPSSAAIVIGGAIQLTATPADTFGDPVRVGPVSWTTDNANVAVVSPSGLVTAVGQGQTTIRATVNGVSGQSIIQVVPPTSLILDGVWDWTERIVATSVTCNDTGSYAFTQVGVNFTGQSQQVGSCATPGDNVRTDPVTTGLISGNDISFGVGSGGNTCSYTGHATGTPASSVSGTVSCSDGSTGTWSAVRKEPVASVSVTPATLALFPGNRSRLTAALLDGRGRRLFFRSVAWASDRPLVASVDGTGFVTANDSGSATITADAAGTVGTSSLRVNPHVASVTVRPVVDSIAPGATAQFTAVAKDAAGNPISGVPMSWSSSNATVATVSGTGLATGLAAGTTLVGASVDNAGAAATLTVTGNPVDIGGQWRFAETWYGGNYDEYAYHLCDDTGSVTLTQIGFTFTGTEQRAGTCPDESPFPVRGGLVNGRLADFVMGCGYSVVIQGSLADRMMMLGNASGCPDSNTFVTSFQAVRVGATASITLQPGEASLVPGDSVSLRAVLRDAVGDTLTLFPITWSSDNPAVARVSPSGVVTGVGPGTATISAGADGRIGTATISVITVSFSSVSAGYGRTCGVTLGGAPFCWGNGASFPRTVSVSTLGGLTFASASIGWTHACLLSTQAAAYCWGANEYGEVGNAAYPSYASPVAVTGGLSFAQISAGPEYTCGATTGGVAYCWGRNYLGELGIGAATGPESCAGIMPCSTSPIPATNLPAITSVSAAGDHTCALASSGQAYCWGRNDSGELGIGTTTGPELCLGYLSCSTAPAAVAGGHAFIALSAGGSFTCGLIENGAMYCWGFNVVGQLGSGTTTGPEACGAGNDLPCSTRPVAVVGGLAFASFSVGVNHACGLTATGAAYCWGLNDAGQLGIGYAGGPESCFSNFACSTRPLGVVGGLTFSSITAGADYTCGITTSRETYCWGYNTSGQVGDGTTTNRSIPVKVAGQP